MILLLKNYYMINMKTLIESLFDSKTQTMESLFDDDLVKKDPFEEVFDHLDAKKYSDETTEEALNTLFNIGGKRYGLYSMGGKKAAFLKAIRKNDWVMLTRKNNDHNDNYAFLWTNPKNDGYLVWYGITRLGDWVNAFVSIGWATDSDFGSAQIFDRLGNMGYEECILITDKKIKDTLKRRLKELRKP